MPARKNSKREQTNQIEAPMVRRCLVCPIRNCRKSCARGPGARIYSRHRPDSPRKRNNLLFGCGREWLFRRPCSARRIWAMWKKPAIGCQRQTRPCWRNIPSLPRSTKPASSAAQAICTVSCRWMKMRRLPSIVCDGMRTPIPMRTPRSAIGRKTGNRCCSLPILTALHTRPTRRSGSLTTAGTPANGGRPLTR